MPRHAANFSCAPIAILVAIAGLVPSALAQSFHLMGTLPPTYPVSRNTGLSADGLTATGYLSPRAGYTWTAASGRIDFGIGTNSTQPLSISGDGQVVVGAAGASGEIAFRWSQASGYQTMTRLTGYSAAEATDANFDGSIIVGTLSNGSGSTPQAFRWTQATGMHGLGTGTTAEAISGDGSTIVGWTGPSGNRPFVWTSGTGLQLLSTIDGTTSGFAFATNNVGNIVVGLSGVGLRTTMWVNGSPVELLSTISNLRLLTPHGVSDDGSVVAGQINAGINGQFAGVWTPSTLTMRLDDYLALNGVTIPAGVTLTTCTAVSADGHTFVGYTSGSQGIQGFVATTPTPCPADLDNDGSLSNGGTRDRAVTVDDLLYLLTAFESGNLAADLDNGSGTGTRDNAVTIEDLLYFLSHFEAGC